ncbi:unnamed protein product [Tilletia controversa]|uniref:Exonuclease V, mitochondrial n=1 Tax=Tilletia controversa TaxID=13291 RepID=A0A8X7SXD5_9BASI|nr:hypothetical protein CF328_g3560 [Tilletia controversa]KAE8247640.1 hypothetical protein A4X06_0g4300 [Tilletia controversa]CAD6932645.1 unnamed protein product [Tilletia controversa]
MLRDTACAPQTVLAQSGVLEIEACVASEPAQVKDEDNPAEPLKSSVGTEDKDKPPQTAANQDATSAQDKKERRPKKPSESLSEHANNRGYLSVTDLVSLAWCEFQSLYGVLGGRNLPLDQRPTSFTTKTGAVIIPDREIAVEREKTLEKGRAIHAELEKELYGEQIVIPTETAADKWALRILEVCCGLKNLLNDGICREVRVFAIIEGFLVFGQIDEIELKRPGTAKSAVDDAPPTPSKPSWASQEQWRRDQVRREKAKKITLSPSEARGTQKLDAFFSRSSSSTSSTITNGKGPFTTAYKGGQSQSSTAVSQRQVTKPEAFLVVSDSKTRFSATIPREESQTSARLQCMLYRRMLEELCLGAEQYVASEQPEKQALGAASRQHTEPGFQPPFPRFEPCDIKTFLTNKKLDLHAVLSDAFIAAGVEWCTNIGLFTSSDSTGGIVPRLNTIHALICSLADVVAEVRSTVTTSNLMGEELGLTYRHRATFKRKKTQVTFTRGQGPEKNGSPKQKPLKLSQPGTKSPALVPATPERQKIRTRKSRDRDLSSAKKESIQQDLEEGLDERCALDLRNEREVDAGSEAGTLSSPTKLSQSQGLSQSQTGPSTPRKTRNNSGSPSAAAAKSDAASIPSSPSTPYHLEQQIIAKVAFTYSAAQLDAHLAKVMPVWLGARVPDGVKEAETYKCNSCEYRANCEWRAVKAQEAYERVRARRIAAEEARLWGDQDADLFDELEIAEGVGDGDQKAEGRKPAFISQSQSQLLSQASADDNDSEAAYWGAADMPDADTLDRLESQHASRVLAGSNTSGSMERPKDGLGDVAAEEKQPMPSSEADLWKDMLDEEALRSVPMQ